MQYGSSREITIIDDAPPPVATNKFWMVWNPNGHSPSYKHPTEQSARAEATRLARISPSDHFYVLEAKARIEAAPPINTTELDVAIGGDAQP
jgi:hypothetical protein